MIYTDGIHIAGETLDELHAFAEKVGIKRCWFHSTPRHPHYDKPKRFPLADLIKHGAIHSRAREVLAAAQKSLRS